MSASTQSSTEPKTRSVSGRKDKDGTEKTIELWPLKKKLKHLLATKETAEAARANHNAAVKAVAEETGLMTTVVKGLLKARADDKVFDAKRAADQLSMVLEECGEEDVAAGAQQEFSDSLETGNAKPKRNGKATKSNGNGEPQPAIGAGTPPAKDPLAGTDLAAGAKPAEGQTFGKYLDDKAAAGAPH